MAHIVPLITEAIEAHLTEKLQVYQGETDPRRVNEVKVGRFQDNPLKFGVYIAIQGGDADDPDYRDGIVSLDDFDDVHFFVPPREIGGGARWWRRGVIQFGCYYPGKTEDEARNYAYQVLGSIMEHVEDVGVSNLIDDSGEQAIYLLVNANSIFEGGGPPSNYVWRGKIYWSCLTERS